MSSRTELEYMNIGRVLDEYQVIEYPDLSLQQLAALEMRSIHLCARNVGQLGRSGYPTFDFC